MATANAAATLERADDFAADFAAATLTIFAGATALVSHTLAGFTTANSGNNATATAAAIADETIANSGTANSATITSAGKSYTLTVGESDADLIVSTTNYIAGQTSSINSLVFTFPAA